jgi:hypothetical protein
MNTCTSQNCTYTTDLSVSCSSHFIPEEYCLYIFGEEDVCKSFSGLAERGKIANSLPGTECPEYMANNQIFTDLFYLRKRQCCLTYKVPPVLQLGHI